MSGSMLSLLSNGDSNPVSRGVYNCAQVSSEKSCKEFKNLSNFERRKMSQDQAMYDVFESFARDLRDYMPQSFKEMSFYSGLKSGQSTEKSTGASLKNFSAAQSPKPLNRNPSTTPKIVGAEVKKNIKYQPVYMQRHSICFGEGFEIKPHLNNGTHSSKRSSAALEETLTNLLDNRSQASKKALRSPVSRTFPSLPPSSPCPMEDTQSSTIPPRSCVKERVSFFNKLASEVRSSAPHSNCTSRPNSTAPKETFLSLLRKKESRDSKITVIRLSQLMSTLSAKGTKRTTGKESMFAMKSSDSASTKCCTHAYKCGSNSLPLPLKRRPSFERTKVASSSIAKNMNSIGTNLKRHSLMEDLSLVVPVKLRIAEFEQRISAAK